MPLMSKGQFGARDVHKHIWRLPIPEYDDSNDLHRAIARGGAPRPAVGARALWDDIRADREASGKSTSVTVARREIRKWLLESEEGSAGGGVGWSVVGLLIVLEQTLTRIRGSRE